MSDIIKVLQNWLLGIAIWSTFFGFVANIVSWWSGINNWLADIAWGLAGLCLWIFIGLTWGDNSSG